MVSDIRAGYAQDAYFAEEKNTRKFVSRDGLYYRDGTVLVPDVRKIKV